jgi:hypothetical protein
MQDALLKTYQHVGRISEPGAFRTWLYTNRPGLFRLNRVLKAMERRRLMWPTVHGGLING